MRYLRFRYILPRLAIVCVLWAACDWGAARLITWSLTSGGSSITGAQVDVAQTKASIFHTRVAVKGIEIADPEQPMQNLASVEWVELDLDTAALLRKKAVVNHGIVRGLRFGTPRETSGELPAEVESPAIENSFTSNATAAAAEYAADWLADLEQKLTLDARSQLESVRLAEEFGTKWPAEYASLKTEAKQLKVEVEQLTADAKAANQNPLRNAEFLRALPARVKALKQVASDLQDRLHELPELVEADRKRVLIARERDERFIREKLSVDAIDSKDLTAYLLGEQLAGPVTEMVDWLRWARKVVPSKGKVPEVERFRGENILFAGVKQYPDLLVRTIDLHGVTQAGGRSIELSGTLTDFTTEPRLHGEPLRLRMVSNGTLPIQLQAVIDRTGDTPRDELLAVCNGLPIPKMSLGKADAMSIAVSPNTAAMQIAVLLEDEKLTGNVELVQKHVQIRPVVGQRLGMPEVERALASSLDRVHELTTNVIVTGTLDDPQVQIRSTLGPAVQQALSATMVAVIDRQREKLLAKVCGETDRQLAAVSEKVGVASADIGPMLSQPEQALAQILGPDLANPFSSDHFGRLPAGSLFK